jgi:hypothetical protein
LRQANFLFSRLVRRGIQLICSRLYVNPDPAIQKSILVAGTARSGTTWLAELVASQIPCRTLFEPFHPAHVPQFKGFHYFQYMRPDSQDESLHSFAQKILTGNIRNRWIDRKNERIFSKYRLVKEIRANLMLRWLHDQFPQAPILLILRHPCAVVLSRMKLDWATDRDIQHFLLQSNLVEDHLSEHLDLIASLKTEEEKHTIVWCISNLIPLRQFQPGDLPIIYYEDLLLQPEVELPKICELLNISYRPPVSQLIRRPSSTTTSSSLVGTGEDQIRHWRKALTPRQIGNILRVVEKFGLDSLYGESELPVIRDLSAGHL